MEPARRHKAGTAGFTLLEAIVALTIIGITMIPVMSFLGQASNQLGSAAESNMRAEAQQTVAAFVEQINPRIMPTGEVALSAQLGLRWEATPLVDFGERPPLGGRLGGYSMGFYRIDITVLRAGKDWFDMQVSRTGYAPRALSLTGQPSP